MVKIVLEEIRVILGELCIELNSGQRYIEEKKRLFVVRIFDGVVDAGGGEEAGTFGEQGLVGQEEDGLIGVPILIKVSILFGLEEEEFNLVLHRLV